MSIHPTNYFAKTVLFGRYITFFLLVSVGSITAQELSRDYFGLLIDQLKSSDRETRARAAVTFANARDFAHPAIPDLIAASTDPNPQVRATILNVLGNMGPPAKAALPELIKALEETDINVRRTAAFGVGAVGHDSRVGTLAVIKALKDQDRTVRAAALNGITGRNYETDTLLPSLIEALSDSDSGMRSAAGLALMGKGKEASTATPALLENLTDANRSVRLAACNSLSSVGEGSEAVLQKLINAALEDPETSVRGCAVRSIALIKVDSKASANALIRAANDPEVFVRRSVVFALQGMGSETKTVVPVLVQFLKAEDVETRRSAASAMGMMRPKELHGDPSQAVSSLIEALSDQDLTIQIVATRSLGELGAASKAAIPALINALGKERDYDVRRSAAVALGKIAMALYDEKAVESIPILRTAEHALSNSSDPQIQKESKALTRAIDYLESLQGGALLWIRSHIFLTLLFACYLFLLLILFGLLWLRPISVLQINEYLATYTDLKLPPSLGGFVIPLRYLFLVGFFHYNPRVLDGWVNNVITKARASFSRSRTVEEREIFVPLPVMIEKKAYGTLDLKELRPIFTRKVASLLIFGEGGVGKTSLACLVGKWAMAENKADALCQDHRMIPVILEVDSESTSDGIGISLLDKINAKLRSSLDLEDHLPLELLKNLLKRRRLLLIIDGLSESDKATQASILEEVCKIPINATVVTSRNDEVSDGLPKTTIQPLRIQGNRISSFLEAYLLQRDKRHLLEDEEFFSACRDLSRMAGEGNITVMLAKMYADLIIARKEEVVSYNLPQNVPDLMVAYVNNLNRGFGANDPDNSTVRNAVQVIAWECLKTTYRPMPVNVRDVLGALGGRRQGQPLIKYLEKNLRLIETIGVDGKRLRFTLDPLSEYFAALHFVNTHGRRHDLWDQMLSKVTLQEDAPSSIKGFLSALRDCVVVFGLDKGIPKYVNAQLGELLRLTNQQIVLRSEVMNRNTMELYADGSGSFEAQARRS